MTGRSSSAELVSAPRSRLRWPSRSGSRMSSTSAAAPRHGKTPACHWRSHERAGRGHHRRPADATVKPEDVIEVLRQCFAPEIPVNIIDLGLVYDIAIKPERVDVKMTLTALGCPMAADVMADVRDHLLTLPGVKDAGVDIVYEPVWTPERMSEEARWELGMV